MVLKMLSIRNITALLDTLHNQKLVNLCYTLTTVIMAEISSLVLSSSEVRSIIYLRETDLLDQKPDSHKQQKHSHQHNPKCQGRSINTGFRCSSLYSSL